MERHAQAVRQRAIAKVEVVARGLARQAHAIARVLRTQPRVSFFLPSASGGRLWPLYAPPAEILYKQFVTDSKACVPAKSTLWRSLPCNL